ncbi:hypothetical protein RD110_11050 [Rhodoferax koreense]|uniref:Holin n=2 Tax=Rhodoferax koreensis TaxID=1842727 RepID=A0A1P8JV88_9BURK|nr:hypothetical protein RD110_11050 [Rhodoferax koreense]
MRFLLTLILCAHLLTPIAVWAQSTMKSPLSYSLYEYGAMLGIAMLGGLVRWYLAIRKGDAMTYSLSALIGELCVSAFVGLITFWICEALTIQPLYTGAIVGVSGHLGARMLVMVERAGKRLAEKRLGISLEETGNAPLGER